jgi:hypothetical protein
MLPDVTGRDGIEKKGAVKESTDPARCGFNLVGTRGDELECKRFEAGNDVNGCICDFRQSYSLCHLEYFLPEDEYLI